MAEYTIAKVSSEKPTEYYSEKYKSTTYYIKVMLNGNPKPVEIGKKSPDALKEGDKVYGTVVETSFPNDKFKAESTFVPNGNGYTQRPDHHLEIKAQWAIGRAMTKVSFPEDYMKQDLQAKQLLYVENLAKAIYEMVDRVKGGEAPEVNEPSPKAEAPEGRGYTKAKEARETFSDGTPVPDDEDAVVTDIGDEPINLDDIPF